MGVAMRLRDWARTIKRDVVALYIAGRDPRVPWYVKVAAMAVAAYALSPIDLIPDFIPVLGYLDEVIILPVAIFLVIRMIPEGRELVARRAPRTAAEARRRDARNAGTEAAESELLGDTPPRRTPAGIEGRNRRMPICSYGDLGEPVAARPVVSSDRVEKCRLRPALGVLSASLGYDGRRRRARPGPPAT